MDHFRRLYPDIHMKDLVVEEMGPGRLVRILGRQVVNFGSDSFLGLDQDPRVQQSIIDGVGKWGTHNGSSRMFASVEANVRAEEKIAAWLGLEAALIFPSVTLVNAGAIPGLVTKTDVIIADEFAHNSIQEGIKIARSNGSRAFVFRHNDVAHLEETLVLARPYQHALITIDGVYSMSGELPPFQQIDEIARRHDAILYVDDAHGTGVLGRHGRGAVLDVLEKTDNLFAIGSLSKAFSCLGGFVGCPREFHDLLKCRSNSYIFGGPVPPCYLEAVCTVIDILHSAEYDLLQSRLSNNVAQLAAGAQCHGYQVLGGHTPIVSLLIGDEEATLKAGRFVFDRGYYVQSVTFPAVPYHAGVLRIQVNANHEPEQIAGLLDVLGEWSVHLEQSDEHQAA